MPKRTIKERLKGAARATARFLSCRSSPPEPVLLQSSSHNAQQDDIPIALGHNEPHKARNPEVRAELEGGIESGVEGASRRSGEIPRELPAGSAMRAPPPPARIPDVSMSEEEQVDTLGAPFDSALLTSGSNVSPVRGETVVSPSPSPAPESKPSTSENKSTWLAVLQGTLDLIERASDVFPPLKSTVAGICAVIEVADSFFSNQEEFIKLSKRVKLLDEILRGRSGNLPQEIKDRRDGLARAIENLGKQLEEKTTRGKVKRVAFAKADQQDIARVIQEINFAIEFAMLDVTISSETLTFRAVVGIDWLKKHTIEESQSLRKDMAGIAEGVANLNKAEILKRLGNISGHVFYNKNQRGQCVPGSRVALLAQLLAWAQDKDSTHAFWLNGIVGTGKTAVAETFCSQLSSRGLLGASFFCSIRVRDLSDAHHIVPSLAKTLANRYPRFGDALANILEVISKDPIAEMTVGQQYDTLILRPAAQAFEGYDKSIILCVDAIDECKEIAALKDCLSSILSNKPAVPLKVFFTSRPELAIKQEVEASSHSLCCESLGVDNIGKDTVRADIALYVSQELKKVRELEEEYGERWPPPEVEKIVEQSDSLFVIAATIVRDICSDSGNPVERLQECGRAPKLPGVRELYDGILSRATANLRPPEKDTLRSWLSLLVVSFKPLTLAEYAALLDRPVHAIQASFKMLHSVIKLPSGKDDDGPISTHHASFASFLTRSIQRSEGGDVTPLLPIDIQTAHAMTFECCLRLMNDPKQSVHPGIPEGVISCKSNTVPLIGTPRQSLPAGVAYACMFLLNHYLRGLPRLSPESKAAMTTFIEEKGLYWFRALTSGSKKVGFSGVLKLYDVDKDGDELRAVTNTLRGLISRADPLYIDHPSCTASEPVRATITQGPDSKTTRVWIAYESTPVMPSTAAICSG